MISAGLSAKWFQRKPARRKANRQASVDLSPEKE